MFCKIFSTKRSSVKPAVEPPSPPTDAAGDARMAGAEQTVPLAAALLEAVGKESRQKLCRAPPPRPISGREDPCHPNAHPGRVSGLSKRPTRPKSNSSRQTNSTAPQGQLNCTTGLGIIFLSLFPLIRCITSLSTAAAIASAAPKACTRCFFFPSRAPARYTAS